MVTWQDGWKVSILWSQQWEWRGPRSYGTDCSLCALENTRLENKTFLYKLIILQCHFACSSLCRYFFAGDSWYIRLLDFCFVFFRKKTKSSNWDPMHQKSWSFQLYRSRCLRSLEYQNLWKVQTTDWSWAFARRMWPPLFPRFHTQAISHGDQDTSRFSSLWNCQQLWRKQMRLGRLRSQLTSKRLPPGGNIVEVILQLLRYVLMAGTQTSAVLFYLGRERADLGLRQQTGMPQQWAAAMRASSQMWPSDCD